MRLVPDAFARAAAGIRTNGVGAGADFDLARCQQPTVLVPKRADAQRRSGALAGERTGISAGEARTATMATCPIPRNPGPAAAQPSDEPVAGRAIWPRGSASPSVIDVERCG
jgi:hypothetical protein